ncbi:MAG: protein NO VEIN domain-containing protein, partial [Planktothrix sp.]
EERAKQFYEKMGYKVEKIDDWSKAGYDFECCSGQNNPQKLWVEVKTISSDNPIIRLKPSQWEKMQTPKKRKLINPHTHIVKPSFEYQLLIVAHTNRSPDQIIQVSDLWEVLKLFVSRLYDDDVQNKTEAKYKKLVEVIVGFQQSEKGETNEILLNWHRLLEQAKIDERIKIHPRGNLNV